MFKPFPRPACVGTSVVFFLLLGACAGTDLFVKGFVETPCGENLFE